VQKVDFWRTAFVRKTSGNRPWRHLRSKTRFSSFLERFWTRLSSILDRFCNYFGPFKQHIRVYIFGHFLKKYRARHPTKTQILFPKPFATSNIKFSKGD
jgi:hypothetical protein